MSLKLMTLMLCVFGITTGEFVIAGILPDIAHDLVVSIPAAGLLVTAYAIGMIVGGPVMTALTARFARKPLIVALLVIVVVGNLASGLAPVYPVLFVARIVTALVTATFFANAIVIAASTAPEGKQASTVSKLVFGMNLSMMLGAPLGTFIGNNFGWRATFYAISAVCLLGLLLVLRFVPDVGSSTPGTSAVTELRVFGNPSLQLAIVITAVANMGLLIVFTYFAPLLTDLTGFAAGTVPVLLLLYGVGAAVGNFVGGWLSDRALMPSQVGLLGLLALGLVAMWAVSGNIVLTGVMVFLIGAMGFSVIPGMQTRVLNTASAAPTLAIAVNASAYQLAAALAGWLGGRVIDSGLGLKSVYLTSAAVTVLGILLSCYAWLRDRTAARPGAREEAAGAGASSA
ncbi:MULTISPECIES: MFS transporter [Streptomyces]|uniref:MFS transporter n=1 Tax=Streptomyces yunnanensis TaxID=156453 RepID=A0ABY8A3T4_9ACTN|nr:MULTISPECIES: MFS transporter [Streptomyces]AJC54717.1 major facilitator superfamily protein [Streptomyces sp. 769]WEB39468.1 MFS transporter [Streptomyces yunnanensis]